MSDSHDKPVIDPRGRIFESIEAAAETYGVTARYISRLVEGHKHGWRFAKQPGTDK